MTYEHLDTDLVNELLGNGRASLRSLAEELDVSVTTVSNHLSDLEDEGVIEGYTPIVDYDAAGYDVTAVMQLKAEGSALAEITETLRDHQQMMSVYEVTGDYDIVAIGKFKDTDDMNDQIKALVTDPDIKQSNTSIVLNKVAENEQFELEADREDWFGVPIDTSLEAAKKAATWITAVRARRNRLEASIPQERIAIARTP